MSQSSTTAPTGSKTRKLLLQMAVGAITGAVVTFLALQSVEGSGLDLGDPARVLALLLGIVFGLMGIFVGVGTAMPGPGSRLLNVEDEEELREQRKSLWTGAIVCLLVAAMMITLALAGADGQGLVSREAAAAILAAATIATAVVSYVGRNDYDELMRAISQEGMAWGMYVSMTVFMIWGSLAHLGYAPWISPLGMVGGLLAIQLLVIFVVCGRRGLLRPR